MLCARPVVGDAPFMVHLADDLIDAEVPCLKQMADVHAQYGGSVLGVQNVPAAGDGQVRHRDAREAVVAAVGKMSHIVEKPKPDKAAVHPRGGRPLSAVASMFDDLAKIGKGAGGEIQLTDGIARLMQREPVYAFEFEGKRYDCGNKLGYLQATVEFGLKHPSLGGDFAAYLKELRAPNRLGRRARTRGCAACQSLGGPRHARC